MKREFPEIKTDVMQGYASFLVSNWDYVQESFCLNVPAALEIKLEEGKQKAQERFEDQGMNFWFGGEKMQIHPKGTKGKSWVLENNEFIIMIGRGKKDWKVSVRYLSQALWFYNLFDLKSRILKCLLSEMSPSGEGVVSDDFKTWQRISRVDYCFDFYSPKFTKEMCKGNIRKCLVLPSGVKGGLVFSSERDETLTIGFNRKGLQIQVYDKSKEITDISGKDWLYKIYEREGYYSSKDEAGKYIWRVEFRFGKDFIKDRGLLTLEDVVESLKELLVEAVAKRRLSVVGEDTNKARWDLHPLWAQVLEEIGGIGAYLPIGRLSTIKLDAKAAMIKKQISGSLRSVQMLEQGSYDFVDNMIIAQNCAIEALEDQNHLNKIEKSKAKYAFDRQNRYKNEDRRVLSRSIPEKVLKNLSAKIAPNDR